MHEKKEAYLEPNRTSMKGRVAGLSFLYWFIDNSNWYLKKFHYSTITVKMSVLILMYPFLTHFEKYVELEQKFLKIVA